MSLDRSYSLRHLIELAPAPPFAISIRFMFAASYDDFADAVEEGLEWCVTEMQRNPQTRRDLEEDQLTMDIIEKLRAMSITASHDTMIGGHSDVVIEGRNGFLWLGEAKIHKSYDWILSGFDQLFTRYSTGSNNENRGGIIIYIKGKNVLNTMSEWSDHLKKNRPSVTISSCPRNTLVLVSDSPHERSGLPFRIRHIPVSLYFAPAKKAQTNRRRKSAVSPIAPPSPNPPT
jgi:hypothetical protein